MDANPRPAPQIQGIAERFLRVLGWAVSRPDQRSIRGQRRIAGNELSWLFRFEDEHSLSQAGSPRLFADRLSQESATTLFFDLIITDAASDSRSWRDNFRPELAEVLVGANKRYGTLADLFHRFTSEITRAYSEHVDGMLRSHFVRSPVRPSFRSAPDALATCIKWVADISSPKIMLVTGDAGAGKSVFALSLVRELQREFHASAPRSPAPFLVWFARQRPALLSDLIALTLNDLGLAQALTPEAVTFLLQQGRLVLLLDGFDEVSRALRQHAEDNIDELRRDINSRTRGRILLTSRPSFVTQEDLFTRLRTSLEEATHAEHELAPYTDEQMREWVTTNSPEGALYPPERHWQRVDTALRAKPAVREVCRTPVFLRMLSEVLVTRSSVESLADLLEAFCLRMWERERARRPLSLTDEQYFYAYEAVALAIEDDSRIAAGEVKTLLDIYLSEYGSELLASLPGDADTLVADLAIGPLTSRREGSAFVFTHEVLAAYFLARCMARRLIRDKDTGDLWDRPVRAAVWRFFPEILHRVGTGVDVEALAKRIVATRSSGLEIWNTLLALGLTPQRFPADVFRGKRLAGVVFDRVDLRGMSFAGAQLVDVTFDQAELASVRFDAARFHKVKFVGCGRGARMAASALLDDGTEITVLRERLGAPEIFAGSDAAHGLAALFGEGAARAPVPKDAVDAAAVVVLRSLFKADAKRLDYPEWHKVEGRARAWVGQFESEDGEEDLKRVVLELARALLDRGWIERNPNRPRTFVCPERHRQVVLNAMRLGTTKGLSADLDQVLQPFRDRLASSTSRA